MAWFEIRKKHEPPKWPANVMYGTGIGELVKKLINSKQVLYHDSETFEVKEVVKNKRGYTHGAVLGTFINEPNQKILGQSGYVLPLMPHIVNIPLVGEHVVVIEYNGQHFYTGIVNRLNNPNQNAIAGVTPKFFLRKYGDTFKRKDIRRIQVNEGDIVYEGRWGNTIKFGCNTKKDNSPNIRIRAGQKVLKRGEEGTSAAAERRRSQVIEEDINLDKSSIYLSTNETIRLDGMKTSGGRRFYDEYIKGNSIVMNSDKLFLNARKGNINLRSQKNLVLEGDEVFIHAKKGRTIKMGPPNAIFIPTINAEVLNELLFNLVSAFVDLSTLSPKLATPATAPTAAADIAKLVGKTLPTVTDIVYNERYLNKDIMVANPNIKVPQSGKREKDKRKKLLEPGLDPYKADGTFDSDSVDKPSTRNDAGERDVGPRRY